jgi:hypothetical protein
VIDLIAAAMGTLLFESTTGFEAIIARGKLGRKGDLRIT